VQANKSDYNQISGIFCTFDIFQNNAEKQKLFVVKNRDINH